MGETYSAARGLGAWSDGKRLHVAPAAPARRLHHLGATRALTSASPASQTAKQKLRAQVPHLRCFADCWAHAMVARGSIDALVEFRLARWDIAATEVLVEEAGGRALIWDSTHTRQQIRLHHRQPDGRRRSRKDRPRHLTGPP